MTDVNQRSVKWLSASKQTRQHDTGLGLVRHALAGQEEEVRLIKHFVGSGVSH